MDISQGERDAFQSPPNLVEDDETGQFWLAQSPEESARAFFHEGGAVSFESPINHKRRQRIIAVTSVIVVVVLLAAAAVVIKKHRSHTPKSAPVVSKHATTTTNTAVPKAVTNSQVIVQVLNASPTNGLAGQLSTALKSDGYMVSGIGNAPSKIAAGGPAEIFYGPKGLPAAKKLASSLNSTPSLFETPSLSGNNVTLWVPNAQLAVVSTSSTTTSSPSLSVGP